MRKSFLWMLLGGMAYYAVEGLWRIPSNGGWANISMLFVGGLCFMLIGEINQIPAFYRLSMLNQALIGAVIVLVVEFISGYILNIRLGLGIWDYSGLAFNIMGQICLPFGVIWFFLMPFAIWLEDRLNWIYWKAFGGEKPEYDYTLRQAYKELLFGAYPERGKH